MISKSCAIISATRASIAKMKGKRKKKTFVSKLSDVLNTRFSNEKSNAWVSQPR